MARLQSQRVGATTLVVALLIQILALAFWPGDASAHDGSYTVNWSTWGSAPWNGTKCSWDGTAGSWSSNCTKSWQSGITWNNDGHTDTWNILSTTSNTGGSQGSCGAGYVEAPGGMSQGYDGNGNKMMEQPWGGGCTKVNRPPTGSISCPGRVYVGDTISCSASGSDPDGDPVTYWWNPKQSFTATAAGWEYVAVTIGDGSLQNTYSTNVEVVTKNTPPSVSVSCPGSVSVPAGQTTATFSCTATGSDPDAGDTVTVSLGGKTGTGSVTQSFTYAPGQYTISASATDKQGASASNSASVTVTGASSLSVTVSCSPSSIPADGKTTTTCSASVSGGTAPYTYSWGSSSKTFGPHTTPGTFTADVTVTDSKGVSGGGNGSYTVTGGGQLAVSVSCSPSNVSPGGSSSCSASVSGGNGSYSYNWNSGSTSSTSSYSNIQSAQTASVSVRDTAGATGSGSATISVNGSTTTCPPGYTTGSNGQCEPPCIPDPDDRDLTLTLSPTGLIRVPGGYVTARLSTSGSTSNRTATASWGETQSFQNQNGQWVAVFTPPPVVGEFTITASARISQSDGCGDTYGPSTFSDSKKFSTFKVNTPSDPELPPSEDDMAVANLTLDDYLKVCLGSMEPWYCGIDFKLAETYTREIRPRETWYMSSLGPDKWALLVSRIDRTYTTAGYPPSGLYVPPK